MSRARACQLRAARPSARAAQLSIQRTAVRLQARQGAVRAPTTACATRAAATTARSLLDQMMRGGPVLAGPRAAVVGNRFDVARSSDGR